MAEIINVGIAPDYNAWLVKSERNVLIDAVPVEFSDKYIKNIEEHIGVNDIDCFICNHASPERAGALISLLDKKAELPVFATVAGLRNIKEIINRDFCGEICKNGLVIYDDFEFCITPNVPWPDTMLTFMHSTRALFSAELFSGDTETFYTEKLSHFPDFVRIAAEKASAFSPCAVYTGAGEIIHDFNGVYSIYKNLTEPVKEEKKVIIPYVSESGNTKKLAEKIKEAFEKEGFEAAMYNLAISAEADKAVAELAGCGAVVLGTYTYKRSMPGCVFDFLSAFDVNTVSGKPYFVFGSQGWSGEGTFMADSILSMLKLNRCCKPLSCIFTPDESDFEAAEKCAGAVISCFAQKG